MQNKIENKLYKVGNVNGQDIFCNLYLYLMDGESYDYELQDGTIVVSVVDRWVDFVREGFELAVDINVEDFIGEEWNEGKMYGWYLKEK